MSITLQLYQLQSQYPQHSPLFDALFKKYELVNDCDDDILAEQIENAVQLYSTYALPQIELPMISLDDKQKKIIRVELTSEQFPGLDSLLEDKELFDTIIDDNASFVAQYLNNVEISTGVNKTSINYEIEYPQTNRVLTEYSQAVMMAFVVATIGNYLTLDRKNIQVSM